MSEPIDSEAEEDAAFGNPSPPRLRKKKYKTPQAVESIAKVACGLLFSHYVFTHETQVLAYFPAGTPILPIAAAAAVLGVTLSTACEMAVGYMLQSPS